MLCLWQAFPVLKVPFPGSIVGLFSSTLTSGTSVEAPFAAYPEHHPEHHHPTTHLLPLSPAVIQRISACSQLIAAQQLIVITDTCGTSTRPRLRHPASLPPSPGEISTHPPTHFLPPLTIPPLTLMMLSQHITYQAALGCRLSVCGFDCHLMCVVIMMCMCVCVFCR